MFGVFVGCWFVVVGFVVRLFVVGCWFHLRRPSTVVLVDCWFVVECLTQCLLNVLLFECVVCLLIVALFQCFHQQSDCSSPSSPRENLQRQR